MRRIRAEALASWREAVADCGVVDPLISTGLR